MSGFFAGLTGATWGHHIARPAAGRADVQQRGVARPTRLGRWVWRNRLTICGPVAVAVWLALRPEVRQVGDVAWWHIQDRAAEFTDRLTPPAAPRPEDGWWWQPVRVAVAAVAVAMAAVVAGRWWPDPASRWGRLVRTEKAWRLSRRVEHHWEQAMWDLGLTSKRPLGAWRVPRLQDVRVTEWGGFTGRLRIPKGFVASQLDDQDTQALICRELDMGGQLGVCEQVVLTPTRKDRAKWREVELVFAGLPDPGTLPVDLRAAPSEGEMRIGVTGRGWLGWNLDQQPFLRLTGPTGKGKGAMLKWMVCQAVRAGWLVVIIDGAGAPEHARWSRLPNVLYYGLDLDDPQVALDQFKGQLALVQRIAAARRRLCLAQHPMKDDWKSLSAQLRRENPRILVVFDEFTALVGKAPEGEEARAARQEIGFLINRMMRLYRKYGVNAVISDQITYAGTYVGSDGVQQATQFVAVGQLTPVAQRMISQGTRWAPVPNLPGWGNGGVVGEPTTEPLVWRLIPTEDIDRVVDEELALWAIAA